MHSFMKVKEKKGSKVQRESWKNSKAEQRGRLSGADGFSIFARGAPYSLKTLKVRRDRCRVMMSRNTNHTSALPLFQCFRSIVRAKRKLEEL